MRACVQRVSQAQVVVEAEVCGQIGPGLVVLLGVAVGDTVEDVQSLAAKIVDLRIFDDEEGKPNCSLVNVQGDMLVISQFTLLGDCRKGRRPATLPLRRPSWPSNSTSSSSPRCAGVASKSPRADFADIWTSR